MQQIRQHLEDMLEDTQAKPILPRQLCMKLKRCVCVPELMPRDQDLFLRKHPYP